MSIKQLIQQLIQIPSVSGNEKDIQQWIFDYLIGLKLVPQWIGENVVVKISGKDSSKALIFNGHVDTVNPGDTKNWNHDPFSGEIIDGKVYGLGASDMKGAVAVMLALAQEWSLTQPPCDLWFHFVVHEETDGSGTEEVMKWFTKHFHYQKLAGIIAEATGLKVIDIAHKGNIFLKVTVQGDGGHGSTPEKVKLHAISKMYKVAKDLKAIVGSWQKEYSDKVLGSPTIVLTSIHAGNETSPNKIADVCTATLDLRTTPKIHDKALELLKKACGSQFVTIKTLYSPLPSGHTNGKEAIVMLTQKVTGLPTGKNMSSTDLLFFTKAGIPAIILGPGEKFLEHTANEYVYLSKVEKCLEIYKEIILKGGEYI